MATLALYISIGFALTILVNQIADSMGPSVFGLKGVSLLFQALELDVVSGVMGGLNNNETADRLFISRRTVDRRTVWLTELIQERAPA
jgi:hypothetical protein